jgi:hypothetical protein
MGKYFVPSKEKQPNLRVGVDEEEEKEKKISFLS